MGDLIASIQRSNTAKNALAVLFGAWAMYSQQYPHTILGQAGALFAVPLGVFLGIRSGGVSATQPAEVMTKTSIGLR